MNKNFTPSTLIILLFVLLGSHSKLNAQCANVIINSFTVSTDSVCPGSEVRLYVSTDYSNTIAWDLGNGKKADDRNVSTKYTTAGKYYITCLVTNDCGSDSLLTDSIVVTSAIPYFTLSASPSNKDSICPNEKVNFYAGEHFKSVFWNFDNGSTSNKISVDQKFASVGVHTYTLTLTDFLRQRHYFKWENGS